MADDKLIPSFVIAAFPFAEANRFMYYIDASGGPDACWLWTGWRGDNGYGRYALKRRLKWQAHRLAFKYHTNQQPVIIDHLCRTKCCVNPLHLENVTNRINVLRGSGPTAVNATKTHCVHGHPLSGANLRIVKTQRHGQVIERRCRICVRDQYNRRKLSGALRANRGADK